MSWHLIRHESLPEKWLSRMFRKVLTEKLSVDNMPYTFNRWQVRRWAWHSKSSISCTSSRTLTLPSLSCYSITAGLFWKQSMTLLFQFPGFTAYSSVCPSIRSSQITSDHHDCVIALDDAVCVKRVFKSNMNSICPIMRHVTVLHAHSLKPATSVVQAGNPLRKNA